MLNNKRGTGTSEWVSHVLFETALHQVSSMCSKHVGESDAQHAGLCGLQTGKLWHQLLMTGL